MGVLGLGRVGRLPSIESLHSAVLAALFSLSCSLPPSFSPLGHPGLLLEWLGSCLTSPPGCPLPFWGLCHLCSSLFLFFPSITFLVLLSLFTVLVSAQLIWVVGTLPSSRQPSGPPGSGERATCSFPGLCAAVPSPASLGLGSLRVEGAGRLSVGSAEWRSGLIKDKGNRGDIDRKEPGMWGPRTPRAV